MPSHHLLLLRHGGVKRIRVLLVSVAGFLMLVSGPAGGHAGFGDVGESYYTTSVQWLVDNEITTGTSPGCFSPNEPVTRGQAAAFLWRMEDEQPAAAHSFTDVVASWQQGAVSWMNEQGITTGTSANTFSPSDTLTRGQMAALLHRMADQPAPAKNHPFGDIERPWQQAPVSWLAESGITTGTSPTEFSPESPVTRGQMATFLYRYKGSPSVTTTSLSPYCRPGAPTGLQDAAACRMTSDQPGRAITLNYVRPVDRIDPTGTVNVAVVFTDFPDVPAADTPQQVFANISPGGEDFLDDQSYGRLNLVFHPHFQWLRLSQASSVYGDALTSFSEHQNFIQEAVDLADPDVDFSGADAVLVVATPNATSVGYGPTFIGWDYPDFGITADGIQITNAITSGTDLLYWGDLWYPHEFGHSMGLPDLYGTNPNGGGGFTRPFSLMDDIGSEAPGYTAYSRWILSWLDDQQIACVAADTDVTLTPVETSGGLKAAIVRLSDSQAIIVESRRALGYDSALTNEGVVVYILDTNKETQTGPMEALNHRQALLAGESVTYSGVTVTVVEASSSGDVVRIDLPE
jgi:M6 family metalloprotease-like protein